MTPIRSTSPWRLLIGLIWVVRECTWIELAICWPFMAEKVVRGLASFKMSQSRLAKQWVKFPCGWDTLPNRELDVSVSRRLMKFWLDVRGWRKRTGGKNVCIFKNALPLCTSSPISQQMLFLSSPRLLFPPLGWRVQLEVFGNGREMGPHLTSSHHVEPWVLL